LSEVKRFPKDPHNRGGLDDGYIYVWFSPQQVRDLREFGYAIDIGTIVYCQDEDFLFEGVISYFDEGGTMWLKSDLIQ
jgi:hypothetical protein